jgi:hypothetical protein
MFPRPLPTALFLPQPPDPLQVAPDGGKQLHRRAGIVHPAHGELHNPPAFLLCPPEQFSIEEPTLVPDAGHQRLRRRPAERLEAALRVCYPQSQRRTQEPVVAPAKQLALPPARGLRTGQQPRANGHVRRPGQQRRQQGR